MSAGERLAANRSAFADLEARVLKLADAGADAEAAAWAQIAADHAWHSPHGAWAAPAIDDALERIGLRACPRGARPPAPAGRRRVLHVATECAAVGGHSRMAWRWIRRDTASVPTLALTRHRGPVPDGLADAVAARDGRVEIIEGHDQLARARALGRLVNAADAVVLHVHPFDAVAPLALADRDGRPPVLLVNHADHCFWLSPRVPDLVVSTRRAAARTAVERRGVAPERSVVLPVPADAPAALPDRARARRELGLPPEARVLVAMASGYKLERIDDVGFLDLMEPIVAALPQTILVAVGPEDAGAWRDARARSGGRIRALGVLPDPSAALAAADLFVDGYPCSSLTAALEATAAGLPVVSHQPPRPQAATYDIDEPALGDAHVRATTAEDLAAVIGRLASDDAARRTASAAALAASSAMSDGAAWARDMEGAYARAAALAAAGPPARRPIAAPTVASRHEDAFLLALHEASGMTVSREVAIARNGDVFASDPRAGLVVVAYCRDDVQGLQRLLASAVATCDEIDAVEAIVIDDASTDGTGAVLAGLGGDVRWLRNAAPLGAVASWPRGVELAGAGEAALLVTSDVVLADGWIAPLAAALARPGVSAVAPRLAGGTGREVCVLASLGALRNGCAIPPLAVPEAVVLGARASTPHLEVAS